jgi:hypothetical protein
MVFSTYWLPHRAYSIPSSSENFLPRRQTTPLAASSQDFPVWASPETNKNVLMSDNIYKKIELVGVGWFKVAEVRWGN